MIIREELAWAAGFFDGEGNIGMRFAHNRYSMRLRVSITQKDPDTLYRFDEATGNLGAIYKCKPYDYYIYDCINSKAEKVIKQLIPWLSSVKLKQTTEALKAYKEYKNRHTLGVTS